MESGFAGRRPRVAGGLPVREESGKERGGVRTEPVDGDGDSVGTCGQRRQLDSLACGCRDLKARTGHELHAVTERWNCAGVKRNGRAVRQSSGAGWLALLKTFDVLLG